MFKYIFLFILFSTPYAVFGQVPLTFTNVVQVDSTISKDELFSRARLWFSETFIDSKAVLEVQDKESGELAGKATINYIPNKIADECYSGIIRFTVRVFVKDGRYKYEIQNFSHQSFGVCELGVIYNTDNYTGPKSNWGTTKGRDQINWTAIKNKIESVVSQMIGTLKQSMSKTTTKKVEW